MLTSPGLALVLHQRLVRAVLNLDPPCPQSKLLQTVSGPAA